MQVAAVTHCDTPEAIRSLRPDPPANGHPAFVPDPLAPLLVMLGADEAQIALTDKLLQELDGPGGLGTKEFAVARPGNQVVQVAYVNAATPQSLQETVNEIRSQTKLQRVFAFNPRRAVGCAGRRTSLRRHSRRSSRDRDCSL